MQGQIDAARQYMEEADLHDDDLKESMLSGSPPKQSLASKRRASRSDQRDVGDVDEDDFENPNRALSPGRGGRGSFNAGNTKGGRDQKTFPLDEELKEQDEDTGSAGQALDSTSGMNKAPKERLNVSGSKPNDPTSQYNQAGQAERHSGDDSYTADDTTSSGGYGVNAGGDSFSPRNQSGIGGNAPGQFK